jgi:pimeloyl-ACP methyl ester carboxylesterase
MTPWILLRGLMRDARHWGDFAERFGAAVGAPTITLDLPGNGSRYHDTSPASVPAMADWCRAELRRQGIAPPYRLFAMSLGAMVAVAWAAQAPYELDAVVLVNTSLKPFSPFWRRLQPRAWPTVLRNALTAPDAETQERAVLRLTSRHHAHNAALLAQWTSWHRAQPVSRANGLRQLWAAAQYHAPHQAPQTRLLVLTSQGDALVDHRCSLALAHAWNTALAIHPSAGHDLPLDDSAWVAARVAEWLRPVSLES